MVNRYLGMYEGQKVYHNMRESMSGHIVITGKSGSGKTVKAQQLIMETVTNNCTVLTFDFHGVLVDDEIFPPLRQKFSNYVNSIDVYEDGIKCNLLTPIENLEGKIEKAIDVIASITDIFSKYFRFGSNQRSVLYNALKFVADEKMYDKNGIQSLGEALSCIHSKTAFSISERVECLTSHNLFRPGEFFLKENKINILRLNGFDDEMQKFATEMVLRYVWRLALAGQFKKRNVCIFVDEVSNFSKGDSVLKKLLTEGRKLGVHLILATQHLDGLGKLGHELLQADMILYFKPDDAQIRAVAKLIHGQNIDRCSMVLSNLSQGEFIAVGKKVINDKEINYPLKVNSYESKDEKASSNVEVKYCVNGCQ